MPIEDWPNPIDEPSKPMDPNDPAFVITCVGWHTQRRGNEGLKWFDDQTRLLYGTLIRFLQDNGLTTREILPPGAPVSDQVAIRMGDLNSDGWALIQAGYSKWLDRIDHGGDPTDTKILERALKKIRAGKADKWGE
jgi:hypothetical protein